MDEKKKERLQRMCAVVSTVAEVDWMPKSMVYIAIGSDLRETEIVLGMAEKAGFIESTAEVIKVTPEGREFAAAVDAEIARNIALVEKT